MTAAPVPMPDRRLELLGRDATFNGLDFAEVRGRQIDVHFINRVRVKGTLAPDRPPVTLTVSGAAAEPFVRPVDESADWSTDTSGRPVLRVSADLPDAPASYILTVHSDRVDPCFGSVAITVRGRGDTADCGGQPTRAGRRASRRSRSTTWPRTSPASCRGCPTSPPPATRCGSNGPRPTSASC